MKTEYKYQQVISFINEALAQRTIRYGDKIPSLRRVSKQFHCSLSVVLQAYQELEMQGVIRSVEKSGYFAVPQKSIALPEPQKAQFSLEPQETKLPSFIKRVIEISSRKDILPLNAAIPSPEIMPVKKLQQSIIQSLRSDSGALFTYQPLNGEKDLRSELAKILFVRGVVTSVENLVITNGCMEALAIAIEVVTEPLDIIAVETPTYFGLLSLLETMQRRVIEIPTSPTTGIELDVLAKVSKKEKIKACIFSANFQNPLGYLMPEQNKKALVSLADRNGFTLIEDDIYGECGFSEQKPRPAKYYDKNNNHIYCSSVSKTLVPGYRIGWAIPGKFQAQYENQKLVQTLGNPPLLQLALANFFASGAYQYHMRRFCKKIESQAMQLRNLVERYFPQGTKVSKPAGGYFLWIELPVKLNMIELFEKALEHGIGFLPGMAFTASDRYKNCLRLSCGFPVDQKIEEGLMILAGLIKCC